MTQPKQRHAPVLFEEAMDFLRVRPGATVVDCTLGLAGTRSRDCQEVRAARASDWL